jgi:hypothetical protein
MNRLSFLTLSSFARPTRQVNEENEKRERKPVKANEEGRKRYFQPAVEFFTCDNEARISFKVKRRSLSIALISLAP